MGSAAHNPLLAAENVTITYPSGKRLVTAVADVSFKVEPADRLVLLGPSGCGKSTLLKAVAGFLKPSCGRILLDGTPIQGPSPERVMVFQEFDQLLPWKTLLENIVFALTSSRRGTRREAEALALYFLDKVKLTPFARSYPHALSGGMKQRGAIARCLAMKPSVLLMDEPFAALDALTRQEMQRELLALWEEIRFTMLFVTHSISEALALGNRVALLSSHPGRVTAEVHLDEARQHGDRQTVHRCLHDKIEEILFAGVLDYRI